MVPVLWQYVCLFLLISFSAGKDFPGLQRKTFDSDNSAAGSYSYEFLDLVVIDVSSSTSTQPSTPTSSPTGEVFSFDFFEVIDIGASSSPTSTATTTTTIPTTTTGSIASEVYSFDYEEIDIGASSSPTSSSTTTSSPTTIASSITNSIPRPAEVSFTIFMDGITSIEDIPDEAIDSIAEGIAVLFSVDVSQVLITVVEVETRRRRLATSVQIIVTIIDVEVSETESYSSVLEAAAGDGTLLEILVDADVDVASLSVSTIIVIELCYGVPGYYCYNTTLLKDCGAGFYCPDYGMEEPLACETGYYCPYHDLTEMQPCQPGYYCPSEQMEDQMLCENGFYCPGYQSEDMTQCSEGSLCNAMGLTEEGNCPAGSYCPDALSQITCPIGSYCPSRSEEPYTCEGEEFEVCPYSGMTSPIGCTSSSTGGPKCYQASNPTSLESCAATYNAAEESLTYTCSCTEEYEGAYCSTKIGDSEADEEKADLLSSTQNKVSDVLLIAILVPILGVVVCGLFGIFLYKYTNRFRRERRRGSLQPVGNSQEEVLLSNIGPTPPPLIGVDLESQQLLHPAQQQQPQIPPQQQLQQPQNATAAESKTLENSQEEIRSASDHTPNENFEEMLGDILTDNSVPPPQKNTRGIFDR